MNISTGEIYFIRERDYFSKAVSPYVKIGLIHDDEKGRSSDDRMIEHQTGNPRLLYIYGAVKTAAVDHIEALLHRIYATKRISGEWFKFDSNEELDAAMVKAKALSEETAVLIPTFSQVDLLQKETLIGESIVASDEVLELMAEYQFKHGAAKEYSKILDEISVLLHVAVERGEEVEGVARVSTRRSPDVFHEDKFSAEHPDLYEKYTIETSTSRRRFTWTTRKIPAEIQSRIDNEISPSLTPFKSVIEKYENDSSVIFELNRINLELLELRSIAEWDADIAEVKVKLACGTHSEIVGVCKWPLLTTSKQSFDKKSLEKDHPEIFTKYVTKGEIVQTVIPERRRAPGNSPEQ
jgi:hypothetical protein